MTRHERRLKIFQNVYRPYISQQVNEILSEISFNKHCKENMRRDMTQMDQWAHVVERRDCFRNGGQQRLKNEKPTVSSMSSPCNELNSS